MKFIDIHSYIFTFYFFIIFASNGTTFVKTFLNLQTLFFMDIVLWFVQLTCSVGNTLLAPSAEIIKDIDLVDRTAFILLFGSILKKIPT
jgi:hypothetical protein